MFDISETHTVIRGRKVRSKNRDKSIIEKEKTNKALRVEARKILGIPPRGRLNSKQKSKVEEYIAKHAT